jgi:hypothetical protein
MEVALASLGVSRSDVFQQELDRWRWAWVALAVDVGQQILGRLYATRDLSLQRMRDLAVQAGVPSVAVVAALERPLARGFDRSENDRGIR